MLRAGVARETVEQYLGGCKLMKLLRDLPMRRLEASGKQVTFDDLLREHYAGVVSEILHSRRLPLLGLLRGVAPKIGRWR